MGILALLLLLFFWSLSTATELEGSSEEQSCAASMTGPERCGPTIVDGEYQLPPSGTVISAIVNNGPLPPEYQEGYEVTIDATGRATVVVTPAGASEYLGDERTTEPVTTTVDLSTDGLQQLLRDLDDIGVFFITPSAEIEDIPVGGDVSILDITLVDGAWEFSGAGLPSDERATLNQAQRLLAAAVGLGPDTPTAAPADATPSAD